MILLFSEKINNFKKIFKKYEETMDFNFIKCPNCNSDDLIKWGNYKRNIKYINEKLEKKIITIKRVKCKKCGKTHALLPLYIVPYKISLLDVILNSFNDIKDITIDITIDIPFDTIIKWKKDFNKFIPYLKTMFNNISKIEIIEALKKNIFKYYKLFYDINKKILMMIHKGIYNMAYF
ncbi:MAG: hypothetical protein IJB82_00010 [Bacilli bacterium]|nr:hypothetical protein [Bacilli bacterium]